MPKDFEERKREILAQLAVPEQDYTDLSPKGTVDAGIRALVDDINRLDGLVTTSSCAGRVSIFLEGVRKTTALDGEATADSEGSKGVAGVGGKGGGKWLFVSHDPVDVSTSLAGEEGIFQKLGIQVGQSSNGGIAQTITVTGASSRFVHLKFEPMAQSTLAAGMAAGFRESGISGVVGESPTPLVAIRTAGLAFDCIIGRADNDGCLQPMVSEGYIQTLINVANERFVVNAERTERFRQALLQQESTLSGSTPSGIADDWEPADVRRERKRAEGLRRREEMLRQRDDAEVEHSHEPNQEDSEVGAIGNLLP